MFRQPAQRTAEPFSPAPVQPPEPRGVTKPTMVGTVLHFTRDAGIYEEGDAARAFYRVVAGAVRTCKYAVDGHRRIDSFHVEGDVFGLETGPEHRLSAEAVSDCTVVAYRWEGGVAPSSSGDMAVAMLEHAMVALRRSQDHLRLMGLGSAARKVAAFLLEMAERGPGDGSVNLPMNRQDIGDYLGIAMETVSRTMSQFERDGLIELTSARCVVLADRRALRALDS